MERKEHWERVYTEKRPESVSWFEPESAESLALIEAFAPDRDARIVDVGGGASRLVDGLVARNYRHVSVLDLSAAALEHARARLGDGATRVTWIESDVLDAEFEVGSVGLWHDRAVFHFLVDAADRGRYVDAVRRALVRGGHVVIATFADDGPQRCSGLDVARYSPEQLHAQFGDDFVLRESHRRSHFTPSGSEQRFVWVVLQYAGEPRA